jgi:amino acid transporter
MTATDHGSHQATQDAPGDNTLKANSVGLGGALSASIGVISPTIGVIFISGLVISHAGASAPFAFIVTAIAALALGWTLWQFVTRIPSAGSFYPFITQGLGKSVGFVAGWQLLLAYGILGPVNAAVIGGFIQNLVENNTDVRIPWEVYGIAVIVIVALMAWLSIATSMELTLIFVVVELVIIATLLAIVLFKGGDSGQVPMAFTPSLASGGVGAIGVSVAYVVLAVEGFETCTFIAEEVRRPRRTIPIALMGAIIFSGLFYAFALYAIVVGYGTHHLADAQSAASPLNPLANRYVGHWYNSLIDIAAISALFGVNVGASNLVYRLVYSIGRDGVLLPKALGRTGTRQTPYVAIVVYSAISIAAVIVCGRIYGPGLATYGALGYLAGLAVIPIYLAVAVALFFFMYRKHPSEFNWIKHAFIPLVGFVVYAGPLITSLHPFPPAPLGPLAFVALGWLLVGILGVFWFRAHNPAQMEMVGRAIFQDHDETAPAPAAGRTDPVVAAD